MRVLEVFVFSGVGVWVRSGYSVIICWKVYVLGVRELRFKSIWFFGWYFVKRL